MASSEFDEIAEYIERDLKDYYETYGTAMSRQAKKELSRKAGDVMSRFYKSYNPMYYTRTGAMKKSHSPYLSHSKNGLIYEGGVEINLDASDIGDGIDFGIQSFIGTGNSSFDQKYHTSKNYSTSSITSWVWEQGHHGFESINGKHRYINGKDSFSPLGELMRFSESTSLLDRVMAAGDKAASRQTYRVLQFH